MSGIDTAIAELNVPSVEPEVATAPRPAALPYLSVGNAREAIAWYTDVFGASLIGEMYEMDDGRVGHAELQIGDGVLYLADEYPELGLKAPSPQAEFGEPDAERGRHRCDAGTCAGAWGRRAAGAVRELWRPQAPPSSTRSGIGGCSAGRSPAPPIQIQHGDVGYVSVWTPDAERAAVFYGHVLGWTYDPDTHQVTNTKEHIGIYSVDGPPTLFCCYAVADLEGARQAILDGGGTVDELEQFDFGTLRGATDSARRLPSASSSRTPASPVPSSTALGQENFRTSRTR